MYNNRQELLKEIMACEFTLIDLNLYLDTHPYDQRAIYIFNNTVQKARMLRNTYERMYGPLTASASNNPAKWQWIESPWPWEC